MVRASTVGVYNFLGLDLGLAGPNVNIACREVDHTEHMVLQIYRCAEKIMMQKNTLLTNRNQAPI